VILYVRGRRRLALSGAMLAAFLFACSLYGALSVRGFRYLALIGVMVCLVVYWIKPQLMVWVALFLTFAAVPASFHMGIVVGPVNIWVFDVALLLAICYLIPIVRPRFSAYLLPGMFLLTVVCMTVVGFVTGHDAKQVVREATGLFELIGGFVLGLLVVYCDYIKGAMHAIAVTLWFSAGMIVAGSLHAIRLAGVTASLNERAGKGMGGGCAAVAQCGGAAAIRVVTATEQPATAVLAALVAAQIVGRVRPATYLALGPPAVLIALLAFARSAMIEIAVAAVVAFVASLGWTALRRTTVLTIAGAVLLAVTVPGALFLLQHSSAGAWLGDQFTAFNNRVLGGVSTKVLAADSSTLARLAEDAALNRAIAKAPVFGHGLGYAYQLPSGKPGAFFATDGTAYAHNFYLWWLAKAGAVGMAAFALLALTPLIRALRCASAPAKISAAVGIGLLAVCTVAPLPESPSAASMLGLVLGSAMAFASRGRTERLGAEQTPAPGEVAESLHAGRPGPGRMRESVRSDGTNRVMRVDQRAVDGI
jgi:O-Antigen ligase